MIFEVALPDGFSISDDRTRFDLDLIHRFLSHESYWARGRSRALVERSIAHALPLGAYAPDGAQVGFALVVTDRAVVAALSNVFVLPAWRGRRLGEALVGAALVHPELATVTRWTLNTDDAHALYAKFGFETVQQTGSAMAMRRPDQPC